MAWYARDFFWQVRNYIGVCGYLLAWISLFAWLQKWKLSLNTSKCKMMCITNMKKLPLHAYALNNDALE